MNYLYKRLFSQRAIIKILKFLAWVPDIVMIPLQYFIKLKRWPHLKSPQRYTEKIQLYKLKYRNSIMGECVDKYLVRDYVIRKGFSDILIPIYGVYNKPTEIDFDSLPSSFVLKTTDGGGGKNVLVVRDKRELNFEKTRALLLSWMNENGFNAGREWAYSLVDHSKIIIEQMVIPSDPVLGLIDYKFFCFNGIFKYLYVITERIPGSQARLSVYSRDFQKLSVVREDEMTCDYLVPKPDNYDRMIEIAEKLSQGFPHVRVDLYNIQGKILFGEMTFYDGSGYFKFIPDSFDFELGSCFDLSSFV